MLKLAKFIMLTERKGDEIALVARNMPANRLMIATMKRQVTKTNTILSKKTSMQKSTN